MSSGFLMAMGGNASGLVNNLCQAGTERSQVLPLLPKQAERPNGFTNGLANLDQAAFNPLPADGEDKPMLDQETEHLGIELGFNPFGLPSPCFIQLALILPQFKEQFDLPAQAHQSGNLDKLDRKSTRLNSSHIPLSRMPSSA